MRFEATPPKRAGGTGAGDCVIKAITPTTLGPYKGALGSTQRRSPPGRPPRYWVAWHCDHPRPQDHLGRPLHHTKGPRETSPPAARVLHAIPGRPGSPSIRGPQAPQPTRSTDHAPLRHYREPPPVRPLPRCRRQRPQPTNPCLQPSRHSSERATIPYSTVHPISHGTRAH